MSKLIDGKSVAAQIQSEVQAGVDELRDEHGIIPGLAVVLVGDDPASRTYVSMKAKTCVKLGMHSLNEHLPADTSESVLLAHIDRLNLDPSIHGILVQLPLPARISAHRVTDRIDPLKDVDGLHPENAGLLCLGRPRFIPCTPLGICELLVRSNVPIKGRHVVIVGRSNLVGRPLSILMSLRHEFGDATVTVCHSASQDLAAVTRLADILVVAIGRREYIRGNMVKPGAVVIDVGTNPAPEAGGKLRGDVAFDEVSAVASRITPVPGGVGPMTIAMLMRNTLHAARLALASRTDAPSPA